MRLGSRIEGLATIIPRAQGTLALARLRRQGMIVGEGTRFLGAPIVQRGTRGRIELGERVVLASDSRLTALGVVQPVIMRLLRADAVIKIGDDSGISGAVICASKSIVIGRGCLIGSGAIIVDTDFHPVHSLARRYAPMPVAVEEHRVSIADNVFIGARAQVLKGVSIGENSVVGAGSVVTKSVAAGLVVAGNPARVVGEVR